MGRGVRAAVAVLLGMVLALVIVQGREPASSSPQMMDRRPLPPIAPLTLPDLSAGGFVTRLSNVVQPSDEPLEFDHLVGGGGWSEQRPTVLVVPSTGWWRVGADITTLGTAYGGPPNDDVKISVVRNWDRAEPYLLATVAAERFHNGSSVAEINSLRQPLWLKAGDKLELLVSGGPDGLLVESNPSDGLPGGFRDDDGPGTLSPHFFLLPL